MEGAIMGAILNDGKNEKVAATEWLKANPGVLDGWLAGVQTVDGKDGLAAVKAHLGLYLPLGERVSWNGRDAWPGRSALRDGDRRRWGSFGHGFSGTAKDSAGRLDQRLCRLSEHPTHLVLPFHL